MSNKFKIICFCVRVYCKDSLKKRESARFVPDPFLGRGLPAGTTVQAGESVRGRERLAGGARFLKVRAKGVLGSGETSGVDPKRGPLNLAKSIALAAGLVPLEVDAAGR
jgi:hypothetical protein